MGYRSCVAITMNNETNQKFLNSIQEIEDKKLQDEVVELLSYFTTSFDDSTGITYRSITDIKWYDDSMEDIKWVMNFIRDQNEEDYKFIRIGDDYYDDIETHGYLYDEKAKEDTLNIQINVLDSHGNVVF